MAENEQDRHLEDLLDSLLSTYAAVEPRPGIEMRIRARLQAYSVRRCRSWTLVLAASAAMVVFATLMIRTPTEPLEPANRAGQKSEVVKATPAAASATKSPAEIRQSGPVARSQAQQSKTVALIQMANSFHGDGDPVSEDDNPTSVTSSADQDQEQGASGDKIAIKNLGVQSLEIKELAPAKNDEKSDEKGEF